MERRSKNWRIIRVTWWMDPEKVDLSLIKLFPEDFKIKNQKIITDIFSLKFPSETLFLTPEMRKRFTMAFKEKLIKFKIIKKNTFIDPNDCDFKILFIFKIEFLENQEPIYFVNTSLKETVFHFPFFHRIVKVCELPGNDRELEMWLKKIINRKDLLFSERLNYKNLSLF